MDAAVVERIRQRASGRCEYCQVSERLDLLPFQVDHVIAEKHHGGDELDNLALACFACNNHKGPNIAGLDTDSGELVRLFHPRRDRWEDHFEWQGGLLSGRTTIGRVTVDVLAINLPHRVQLREALIQEGVFPPPLSAELS